MNQSVNQKIEMTYLDRNQPLEIDLSNLASSLRTLEAQDSLHLAKESFISIFILLLRILRLDLIKKIITRPVSVASIYIFIMNL